MVLSLDQHRAMYRAIALSMEGITARFFVATKTTAGNYNPYELTTPTATDWAEENILTGVEVLNLRQVSNESRGKERIQRTEYGTDDCPKWKLTIPNEGNGRSLQEYEKELYCEITNTGNIPTIRGRVESIQIKKTGIIRIVIKKEQLPV